MPTPADNLRINGDRLWDSIHEMAEIGPGVARRQQPPDADRRRREGRPLFKRWCEDAGLTMGLDQMGTMFARREGTEPNLDPVYVGSHLDTQPTGGRYDGVLGVLSGLELVRTLNDLGIKTRRPIVVVNWTNEEGARFAPAMLASGVFAGIHTLDYAYGRKDPEGKTFGDELKRIGWVGDEKVGARKMHAYFEYHIEQGPDPRGREQADRRRHPRPGPLVAGVHADRQGGAHRLDADDHARQRRPRHGPHPRDGPDRRDGQPAGRRRRRRPDVLLAEFAERPAGQGRLHRRHPLARAEEARRHARRIEAEAPKICAALGVGCSVEPVGHFDPVTFDPTLVARVRAAAEKLGYSHMNIISGAGHDACWTASRRRPWSCAPASTASATTRPRTSRRNGPPPAPTCCSTPWSRRRRSWSDRGPAREPARRRSRATLKVYRAFNARDIDGVLAHLAPGVDWPNAVEQRRVIGRRGARLLARPVERDRSARRAAADRHRRRRHRHVRVDQLVRSLDGKVCRTGSEHVYEFEGPFITRMTIVDTGKVG